MFLTTPKTRPERCHGGRSGGVGVFGALQEVENYLGIGGVTRLGAVGGDEPALRRVEHGDPGNPGFRGQSVVTIQDGTERIDSTRGLGELLGGVDDPERVGFGLGRGVAPGGDTVTVEDAADRERVGLFDRSDVKAEALVRTPPRHPEDHFALAVDPGVDILQRTQAVEAQHAKPGRRRMPRSPSDPFTQSNSTGPPVTGSTSVHLAEGLPPRSS